MIEVVAALVLHAYEVPPVAVRVAVAPEHIVALFTVGVGNAFTVTVPEAVAVQPAALVAVTVYVPAVEVVIDVVTAPVLHEYEVPPVAASVAVAPAHMAGLFTVGVGSAFTVTVPAAVAVHPAALVAVTVYVPAVPVVIEVVTAPVLHEYEVPPVAVSVAVAPAHIVGLFTVGEGSALTVTVPEAVAVQPAALVAVTV